ncbi:MAG: M48 family metalloprotease, partial [Deltaproteobacteria bacterium]|nr:M48 family metalloprotease [Deltaproteobacteria bacterium]
HTTAKMTQIENPVNKLIINILVLEGLLKGKPLEGIALAVGFSLSYDREYEMQADILASKILARAGYDPRHFANFILYLEERKGKKETWTWLSTHPASSERYHQINKEAKTFALSAKSARNTPAFSSFKKKLSLLPRTFSIAEFDKRRENKKLNEGIYGRVGLPSSKTKSYVEGRIFKVDIPENWEVVKEDLEEVWISTKGAYGKDGITHGVIIGTSTTKTTNLEIEIEALAKRFLGESQPKLERVPNVKIGSRDGFSVFTVRNSRITKQREVVSFYATFVNSKSLLYVILVIPQEELGDYNFTFLNILNSITLEAGK